MEVYLGEVTDSRATVIHQGPLLDEWQPSDEVAASLAGQDVSVLRRPCKTMLRLTSMPTPARPANWTERAIPRLRADQMVYRASLCEAHVPVVNELIQRYRLLTYDYFAHQVSAWDVPIWYVKHDGACYRASFLRCKEWDRQAGCARLLRPNRRRRSCDKSSTRSGVCGCRPT